MAYDSTNIGNIYRSSYCSFLDIVKTYPLIEPQDFRIEENLADTNQGTRIRSIDQICDIIDEVDASIEAALMPTEGSDSGDSSSVYRTTPYVSKIHPSKNNSGTGRLLAAVAESTAKTDVWKIVITAEGNPASFTLTSWKWGSQGSGSTDSDFTAADSGWVTIPSAAWQDVSNLAVNDEFYFSSYDSKPVLRLISKLISVGYLINTVYSEEVPNTTPLGERFLNRGQQLLRDLADPNVPYSLSAPSSTIIKAYKWAYDIDEYGEDNTTYDTDEIYGQGSESEFIHIANIW